MSTPRRHRRSRGRSIAAIALSGSVVAAFAGLTGCPGKLENPDRFVDAGSCDLDVKTDILAKRCGGSICHGNTNDAGPAGSLDLVSAGVEARLRDVAPKCEGTSSDPCAAGVCNGKLLIDSKNPEQSYVLEKIHEETPTCGDRMPLGVKIAAGERVCLELWVAEVAKGSGGAAGSGGTGGSGGSGGSAGAGGSGGSAGAAGGAGASGAAGSAGSADAGDGG